MTRDKQEALEIYVAAWWDRLAAEVDLDTGKITPPPIYEVWKEGVLDDLKRLLAQQREEIQFDYSRKMDEIIAENTECIEGHDVIPLWRLHEAKEKLDRELSVSQPR